MAWQGRVEKARKFEELVLYVAAGLRDHEAGGATKLNKVMAFSEDECMRRYGHTITGAEYMHLPEGPVPRRLVPVRDALCSRGDAVLVTEPYFDRRQQRLIPRRPADLSIFEDHEVEIVDHVLESVRPMSARQVSDLSHESVGWTVTSDRETIDPALALLRPAVITPEVQARARELGALRRPPA